MPLVSAPSDKRFRRSHVKPPRKSRLGWRQIWLAMRVGALLAVMVYGGWKGTALVLGAPALQVQHVEVSGHSRLSTGEVLALVEGLRPGNILLVRLEKWRNRLLSSSWVEDATLRRVLPSTIQIVIRERVPMGIARLSGGLYLVDAHGVVVDEYGPNYADLDLPIVDGLAAVPSAESTMVDETRAALAARLIASLESRPDLAKRVSQIDVADVHDAVVILDGDTVMLRLGDEDFVNRLQEYLDLGPALRERIPEIDYVDLRFDDRLYVRPAAGRKASATARHR